MCSHVSHDRRKLLCSAGGETRNGEKCLAWAVRAIRLVAVPIERERMLGDIETSLLRDSLLALFDLFIKELFHAAAIQANKMIVV